MPHDENGIPDEVKASIREQADQYFNFYNGDFALWSERHPADRRLKIIMNNQRCPLNDIKSRWALLDMVLEQNGRERIESALKDYKSQNFYQDFEMGKLTEHQYEAIKQRYEHIKNTLYTLHNLIFNNNDQISKKNQISFFFGLYFSDHRTPIQEGQIINTVQEKIKDIVAEWQTELGQPVPNMDWIENATIEDILKILQQKQYSSLYELTSLQKNYRNEAGLLNEAKFLADLKTFMRFIRDYPSPARSYFRIRTPMKKIQGIKGFIEKFKEHGPQELQCILKEDWVHIGQYGFLEQQKQIGEKIIDTVNRKFLVVDPEEKTHAHFREKDGAVRAVQIIAALERFEDNDTQIKWDKIDDGCNPDQFSPKTAALSQVYRQKKLKENLTENQDFLSTWQVKDKENPSPCSLQTWLERYLPNRLPGKKKFSLSSPQIEKSLTTHVILLNNLNTDQKARCKYEMAVKNNHDMALVYIVFQINAENCLEPVRYYNSIKRKETIDANALLIDHEDKGNTPLISHCIWTAELPVDDDSAIDALKYQNSSSLFYSPAQKMLKKIDTAGKPCVIVTVTLEAKGDITFVQHDNIDTVDHDDLPPTPNHSKNHSTRPQQLFSLGNNPPPNQTSYSIMSTTESDHVTQVAATNKIHDEYQIKRVAGDVMGLTVISSQLLQPDPEDDYTAKAAACFDAMLKLMERHNKEVKKLFSPKPNIPEKAEEPLLRLSRLFPI